MSSRVSKQKADSEIS
ncbi:hypothetical protein CSPAE12_01970 [Colletotrichum incanum]|nr:hypothetical protein CSPAE12_01970 [Colletotrichum incanum]